MSRSYRFNSLEGLAHFQNAAASFIICLFAAAPSKAMRLVTQTTVVELILYSL